MNRLSHGSSGDVLHKRRRKQGGREGEFKREIDRSVGLDLDEVQDVSIIQTVD